MELILKAHTEFGWEFTGPLITFAVLIFTAGYIWGAIKG